MAVIVLHGGGPSFFMTGERKQRYQATEDFLRSVDSLLPARPQAILIITAHWEAEVPSFTGHPQPGLIYDYYGFPPETYTLQYPAPGLPALARERIDMSLRLAEESGMRFEDADLLRLRAHTLDQPGERLQALDIARERAREQGATLFELRCLLDHVDFSGKPDKNVRAALAELVAGLPPDPALPEWARAQRILR